MVWSHRCRSNKRIPIYVIGHTHYLCWTGYYPRSLWPDRPICPCMDLLHISQTTRSDIFCSFSDSVRCSTLVPHLSAKAFLICKHCHLTCFPNGMCHWLLYIDMNPFMHRHHCSRCMSMIWSTYSNRIDFISKLVEQIAVIRKFNRIGMFS